jgi:antitoxin MazE
MHATVRKIGNSRGVIIPAPFLAACGIGTEVELRMEGKSLILESIKIPRQGWFDGCKEIDPAVQDTALWDAIEPGEDTGDWQW